MKTSVVKRVIALILAGLIALGTLGGYLFSVVGYAAMSDEQNVGYNCTAKYEIKSGLQGGKVVATDPVTIDVELTVPTALATQPTVKLAENGAFTTKDGDTGSNVAVTGGSGTNWNIKFSKVYYNNVDAGNKEKLQFQVNNGNILSLEIAECKEATVNPNPGPGPGGDDDPGGAITTNASMYVNLVAVYTNKGEKIMYKEGDAKYTNSDIGSKYSGANTYMADFRITITDPDANPNDISKKLGKNQSNSDVKINATLNSGSFRYSDLSSQEKYIPIVQSVEALKDDGTGAKYTILLRRVNYTASGNTLVVNIIGKEDKDNPDRLMTNYTTRVSAIIDQCIPYVDDGNSGDNGDDDPDYSKMEMATPYVIVSNYSYGGQVTAGDTFPLELTFYNTSRNLDVTNMMITISMPDAFMLTSSSNTFYVDQLDAEQSVTQTVQVTAKANAAPQSHNIEVSMKYQYIDDHLVSRRDNSTQETISIPVVQIDRFQVTGVEVSQEIYLNEESYLTVNFVNKGRSDVYNLSAQISGDIQNPGQQQNLGNLTSGSTGTADFYITPNGEGVCTGEVTITYEDTNMEEKTATIQWSTNAVDPMAGMDFGPGMGEFDPGMMEDPTLTDEKKSPTPFIIGGVVIAAGVAAFLIRRRILKKRSEEADANL